MAGRVELGIKHLQPKAFEFFYAGCFSDMWRLMFCLDVEGGSLGVVSFISYLSVGNLSFFLCLTLPVLLHVNKQVCI